MRVQEWTMARNNMRVQGVDYKLPLANSDELINSAVMHCKFPYGHVYRINTPTLIY